LHDSVLRAVGNQANARAQRESWLDTLVAALRARPGMALGGAVAAGMAIGVIGFGALSGGFAAGRALGPATSATLPAMVSDAPATVLELDGTKVELWFTSSANSAGSIRVRLSDAHGEKEATLALPR